MGLKLRDTQSQPATPTMFRHILNIKTQKERLKEYKYKKHSKPLKKAAHLLRVIKRQTMTLRVMILLDNQQKIQTKNKQMILMVKKLKKTQKMKNHLMHQNRQ